MDSLSLLLFRIGVIERAIATLIPDDKLQSLCDDLVDERDARVDKGMDATEAAMAYSFVHALEQRIQDEG